MAVATSESGRVGTLGSKTSLDQQTKKILRYLDDTSKRLDDYTGRCNNIFELFSSAGAPLILRSRLKDLVWRALKSSNSANEIANKALELGWRKIYYEPIHVARRLKKRGTWSPEDAAYVESHIVNGIGHYHSVITYLCDTPTLGSDGEDSFNTSIESRESLQTSLVCNYGFDCDELNARSKSRKSPVVDRKSSSSNKYVKWKKNALHRCFTALGDLSRYRIEFEELQGQTGNKESAISVARMYYNDALLIDPENGMPFNQLAALASNQNFGLDSVYFYLRCLISDIPFKGCEQNLQSLFQQNTNKLNKIETRHVEDDDQAEDNMTPKEACERSVMYLIMLIQELLFEEGTKRLSQFCQKALQNVQKCLYLPHSEENSDKKDTETEQNPIFSSVNQSLSADIASKMVIVLLLVASQLRNEKDGIKVSMIRAYLLALFSHFVTKLLRDAYFCVFGPESVTDLFSNEADQIKEMEEENTEEILDEKSQSNEDSNDDDKDNKASNVDKKEPGASDHDKSRKKSRKKRFHDMLRRKRFGKQRESGSDAISNSSYSSHESIGSTSDDTDEDSDGNLRHITRKRRPVKHQELDSDESRGVESDSDLSSFYSDEDSNEREFLSSNDASVDNKRDSDSKVSDEDSTDEGDDVIVESATEIFSGLDLVKFMGQHHLIPAIRLAFLWLMGSKTLIHEAGEASSILWFRLTKLFNMLPVGSHFIHEKFLPNSRITAVLQKLLLSENTASKVSTSFDWKKRPMLEDRLSRGVDVFETHQSKLEWNVQDEDFEDSIDNDDVELGILRILQFNDFCDWLADEPQSRIAIKEKTIDESNSESGKARIVYLKAKSSYDNLPVQDNANLGNDANVDSDNHGDGEKENEEDDITKEEKSLKNKQAMMQNMAQLWLQQEVRDLEKGSRVTHRTYVIVDHWALISHLNLVKDVVDSRRYVVIIPSTTIQQLDDMKRRNNEAREASRWLERQFQRGNRWLRPQKANEKKLVDRLAYPKRKQRDDWYLIKIVECCNHFINMSVAGNEENTKPSRDVKMDVTWITSCDSGIIEGFQTDFEVPPPSNDPKDDIPCDNADESSSAGSIFAFLKTTAGENLQFENITKFVADNNITRPKMSRNPRGSSSHGHDKSPRERNRHLASNRSSERKKGSETDEGSAGENQSRRRRMRHRRYRTRKSSHVSNSDKKKD